jgi:hypothetical protein
VHGIPRSVLYSRLGFDSSFLSLLGAEEAILKGISLRPSVCKGKKMEHITAYRTQMLHMTRLWLLSNIFEYVFADFNSLIDYRFMKKHRCEDQVNFIEL